MPIFRIKETDELLAYSVSPSSGKILSKIYDSGYERISQVEKSLLRKIPYYQGKEIEIKITNLTKELYKSYTIKANK